MIWLLYNKKIFIIVSITVFLLSLSVNAVFAGGNDSVGNQFFSIEIPDSWVYSEYSDTPEAETTGSGTGNMVWLTPNEFSDLLLSPDFEKFMEKIQDAGAILYFVQETDYPLKNAPIESYVKYSIDQLGIPNITSQQYTTVGKEKAVRIDANQSSTYGSNNIAAYYIMHDEEPYYILYVANPKNYDKYLPEFEQMVKSFKFADSPLNEIENLENENQTNTRTNFSSNTTSSENPNVAEIVLLSQKLKKSDDFRDLVGQIKNIGNDTAKWISIHLTVYDKTGGVVATEMAPSDIADLKPSQKSTFTFFDSGDTFKDMDHYELSLEWTNDADRSKGYLENAQIYKENATDTSD